MAKALTTKTAGELSLEKLERKINTEAFEAFYHIGQDLMRIREGRLYEAVGFKSWSAYCASGRIDYSVGQANRYIQSSELRPVIEKVTHNVRHDWTQRQVLELCKCETDNDVNRVAKKAISIAKKSGERVTAKLIAQVRDGDSETGKTSEKMKAFTLDTHLEKLADLLIDWRISLEQIPDSQWDDVPSVVLTRVKNEANALLKFLRS